MSKKYQVTEVFGVSTKLIKSYIERPKVDDMFKSALHEQKQIVVYGASKQGKTSLILKHLKKEDYVKVECSPSTQAIDIYRSILRQLNIRFLETYTKENKTEGSLGGKANVTIKVPFVSEAEVEGDIQGNASHSRGTTETFIDYNLALAQDVSELLNKNSFNKVIILENFHYLSQETQETLAYDLRIFQDYEIVFVILGIWREANRLVQYNGDLLDRVIEIPVEPWSKDDFRRVIDKGSKLLNVDFSQIQENLIERSFDSIGVVQELCKKCCSTQGLSQTNENRISISFESLATSIQGKTQDYAARHIRNFESFSDVLRKTSTQSGKLSLGFPYYFIKLLLIIDFSILQKGLPKSFILEEIRRIHHRSEDVRSSDLSKFLHNITQHQINKSIRPPFVDYDRGGKIIKIIDSSLYFFLYNSDRNEILNDLSDPLECGEDDSQMSLF
ncbi:AAA family ATPase [Synechococcus sp. BDU 130192]|uniref:AAA family ATPase n=1 Tax=Synechococcus sp. BDU 130192 TaxID=2042059 RepID=UPI000C07A5BD|nr:AAA family ATPase [Synechococcus sp. BDU 130192]